MKGTFAITGMHCANCALGIEKGVGAAHGVKSATVNFPLEELTVEYDTAITSPEAIAAVVKELGFAVGAADILDEFIARGGKTGSSGHGHVGLRGRGR